MVRNCEHRREKMESLESQERESQRVGGREDYIIKDRERVQGLGRVGVEWCGRRRESQVKV